MRIGRQWKKLTTFLMAGILLLSGSTGLANITSAKSTSAPHLKARSGLVIDPKTRQVLYSKKMNKTLPAASTSKLLAMDVLIHQIKRGHIKWDQKVKITSALHKLSTKSGLTNVSLKTNHQYTIKQLYQAALVGSANAATMAIAQKVGGSQAHFVDMMKTDAKQLGIHDAKIYNACGLTNSEVGSFGSKKIGKNAENQMSAKDLAIVASHLLQADPQILKTTSKKTQRFDGNQVSNENQMLPGDGQAPDGIKVDGLKTGTSKAAGSNFVGTAKKHGHRILTVVMHASKDPARFDQTRNLMNYAYGHYHYVAYQNGQKVPVKSVKVVNGKQKRVAVRSARNFHYWELDGTHHNYQLKLKRVLRSNHGIKVPVRAGEHVGQLKLTHEHQLPKSVPNEINLKAHHNVNQASWWKRFIQSITSIFG